MNARIVAQIVAVVGFVACSMMGCAVQTEGTEPSESSSEELRSQLQGPPAPQFTCNPSTMCCTSGGRDFNPNDPVSGPFEYSLSQLGCTRPIAVGMDGHTNWWFGTTCPYAGTAVWVDGSVNSSAGVKAEAYEGTNHCIGAAASGFQTVIWDPTCPSGCAKLSI